MLHDGLLWLCGVFCCAFLFVWLVLWLVGLGFGSFMYVVWFVCYAFGLGEVGCGLVWVFGLITVICQSST